MITEPNNPEEQSILAREWFNTMNRSALTLGRVLRTWRKCEELTLATVAQQVGISKQMLSAYEKDEKLPSIARLMALATVLGVDPAVLLTYRMQTEVQASGYRITQLVLEALPQTPQAS